MATPPPGAPPAAPPAGAPPAASNTISIPGIGPATQQPDGTYVVTSGPAAGVKIGADGRVDSQSLANVQAIAKAQSQPGGLTTQGLTYFPNPDGTLTITGRIDGKPLAGTDAGGLNGATLSANGMYTKPDGTPVMAGDQPMWAARTPSGAPATDNPNYKSNTVTDLVTKDNPIAGTLNAAGDIWHGKYKDAASDFGAGASGGTLPQVDANGNIVPGDTTKAVATDAGVPSGVPGVTSPVTGPGGIADQLGGLLGGLGIGGKGGTIDTSAADAETARANALADALGGKADIAGAQADTDRGLGSQTRAQQEQSISDLQDAAAGRVASPAELQLRQQAGIDASRQYGLAAALQGNNPAAALRQASLGSATIAGTTNQNAGILRANETATARNALANTLSNVRQSDQGAVNTDVNQQGTMTQGQLTSQGQGVTSTGEKLTAEAEKEKADAARAGALVGAAGTLGATLLSDKRAKKDIVKASLADALGKGVHGVTFEYRPESGEDDTPHFGVLADQLERVVPGVVKRDSSGFKAVDTGHMTLANTAILAELAARLMDLEKKQGARR